jgi:hypothetical protein
MAYMQTALVAVVSLWTLAACGSHSDTVDTQFSVYKYFGSVQCAGGGTSLTTLEGQLGEAGVPVIASACGSDGHSYPAACGQPDGRIGILEIPVVHAQTAFSLGFAPLSDLPAASEMPCP